MRNRLAVYMHITFYYDQTGTVCLGEIVHGGVARFQFCIRQVQGGKGLGRSGMAHIRAGNQLNKGFAGTG